MRNSVPSRARARNFSRRIAVTALAVLAGVLVLASVVLPVGDALAANQTVGQCNGVGPSPSGATTAMACTVTVVNTIDGGHRHSTTTLTRHCLLGPCQPGNGTFVTHSTQLVTNVAQCNGSDNDSAHPITCTVSITNNISADTAGASHVLSVTTNQCVGSGTGGGGTVNCDPHPASVTGANVTQCNGSGTGGGGTVHCTVFAASKVSAILPIKVNQCNGTGNPGGSVVTCRTSIRTNITRAATTGGTQVSRVPGGSVQAGAGSTARAPSAGFLLVGSLLIGLATAALLLRRRTVSGRAGAQG